MAQAGKEACCAPAWAGALPCKPECVPPVPAALVGLGMQAPTCSCRREVMRHDLLNNKYKNTFMPM